MVNAKKGNKKSTPNVETEVNQRKITNFFHRLDPNAPVLPSARDKSLIQKKLPFPAKGRTKKRKGGSFSGSRSSRGKSTPKKTPTPAPTGINSAQKIITDSQGNDVIIVSDSDTDGDTDTQLEVKVDENRHVKPESSSLNSINDADEDEIEEIEYIPVVRHIPSPILISDDTIEEGDATTTEVNPILTIPSSFEFTGPEVPKSVKRVLFSPDEETQRIEADVLQDGSSGNEVDEKVVLPVDAPNGLVDLPVVTPPKLRKLSPDDDLEDNLGSDSDSQNDGGSSPSLLANYKPSPSLFEDQETELDSKVEMGNCGHQNGIMPRTRSFILTAPSEMLPSSPVRKTPTKSQKSKPTYFSPVRHLNKNKPGSSKSSNSNSQSKGTYFSPVRHLNNNALARYNSNSNSPSDSKSPSSTFGSQSTGNRTSTTNGTPIKNSWPSQKNPYYLENFETILRAVVSDDFNNHLFNESDWKLVEAFNDLNKTTKCLYVRLFNRQWRWKQADLIKYPDISDNLNPAFEELFRAGFLLEIRDEIVELEVLLNLLTGEQMTTLGKKMNIIATAKTKEKMKAVLMKMATQQRTLQGSSSQVIQKLALELMGPTYKISANSRDLFSRVFILYSPPQYWEDVGDTRSNQTLTILLTDIGQMEYPIYKVSKSTKIYPEREDLVRFLEAWTLHSEIQGQLESKHWTEAEEIVDEAVEKLKSILSAPKIKQYDETLPTFLRAYTAGNVYTRVAWIGIDALQKTKKYLKASEIVEFLIGQTTYLTHYRGRWYERLVINAKQYLKKPNSKVLDLIKQALNDESLQDSHRFGLTNRLVKIKDEKPKVVPKKKKILKSKAKKRKRVEVFTSSDSSDQEVENEIGKQDFDFANLKTCMLKHTIPERTIEGEKMSVLSERTATGVKSVFLSASSSPSGGTTNTISSVENFAIDYFKSKGYIHGVHGEGSVPTSIFGLLFWDIIYHDEIPDVFHTPYQPFPLDIHFEDFYIRRKELIHEFIDKLRNTFTLEDVFKLIDENWGKYVNKVCIVNWSVFKSTSHVKSLIISMGLPMIALICERLAQNYRYFSSGFPDLVVWNESNCIFVEVKGPSDTLSAKQSLWLDFLVSIGAQAEVCHVKSVSNKRIRLAAASDD